MSQMAQPGTFAAIEEAHRSENFQENCSITDALAYQEWANQLGVGFESLAVVGKDNELSLAAVQTMGINQGSPLLIVGITKDGGRVNVALERLHIAGFDGETSFLKVFALRNPKSSLADAVTALLQLEIVRAPVTAVLNKLKKLSGVA
jgi:hypothetical protein